MGYKFAKQPQRALVEIYYVWAKTIDNFRVKLSN